MKVVDREIMLFMRVLNLKEEKNKEYTKENDPNKVYIFQNIDELKYYFYKNGFKHIDDELLSICTIKTTKKGQLICLKSICDYAIKKHKENNNYITKNDILIKDKIKSYLNCYNENSKNEKYSAKNIEDLINKIAAWYEIEYPYSKVDKIIKYNINFTKTNIEELFKILTKEEKEIYLKPMYNKIIYLDPKNKKAHLHITKEGIIKEADNVTEWTKNKVKNSELKGLTLDEADKLFENRKIKLPKKSELKKQINKKEELLDCIMYRILEKGGPIIGPRRAYIFAKEFKRNKDIPITYSIDYNDPAINEFLNTYLNDQGNPKLNCYINYYEKDKNETVNTITVEDFLSNKITRIDNNNNNTLKKELIKKIN